MFEKFSISDIDSAGRGGEYTVQAGFGWTNGALLWIASQYGDVLVAPDCPDLLASAASTSGSGTSGTTGGSSATVRVGAGAGTVGVAVVLAALVGMVVLG